MTMEMTGGSPLWLSHHPPHELDRCVVVGGRHVCRRCVLLWPLTFVAFALALAGVLIIALRRNQVLPLLLLLRNRAQ